MREGDKLWRSTHVVFCPNNDVCVMQDVIIKMFVHFLCVICTFDFCSGKARHIVYLCR